MNPISKIKVLLWAARNPSHPDAVRIRGLFSVIRSQNRTLAKLRLELFCRRCKTQWLRLRIAMLKLRCWAEGIPT